MKVCIQTYNQGYLEFSLKNAPLEKDGHLVLTLDSDFVPCLFALGNIRSWWTEE
jgi:hypothetical protein